MTTSEILGALAVTIGMVGYAPYLWSILKGSTKPHLFSWFIWATLTAIAFAIQISEGAGAGAWVTGITAAVCFLISALSLKFGEKNITRSDWATFIAGLAAIPLWLATSNPLYAVLLITVIDALGFWPTFRKTWHKPYEEALIAHFLSGTKWVFAVLALEQFTLNTALYPVSLILMNWVFVSMALWRRRVLKS
jgi:hypothetical protein